MNCLNLPEFKVIKAEENKYDYRFTVETIDEPDFCPQCFYSIDLPRSEGKPFIKHGIKDREVWDVDMHCKRVKLVIKQRRYKCPVCGGTDINIVTTYVDGNSGKANYCLSCFHEFKSNGEVIPPLLWGGEDDNETML